MIYGLYILSILVENLKIMQPMISIMHVKDTILTILTWNLSSVVYWLYHRLVHMYL